MAQINVVWSAPGDTHPGNFTVCDSEASRYPAGTVISVAVLPGGTSVIVGESRAGATVGFVLESAVALFCLFLVAMAARWWVTVAAAERRWRTGAWLPAEMRHGSPRRQPGRGQPVVANFGEGSRHALPMLAERGLALTLLPRKDGERLEPGGAWVVPTGRTLVCRRRSGPYAVVRAGDMKVFWGLGRPLPGKGW